MTRITKLLAVMSVARMILAVTTCDGDKGKHDTVLAEQDGPSQSVSDL